LLYSPHVSKYTVSNLLLLARVDGMLKERTIQARAVVKAYQLLYSFIDTYADGENIFQVSKAFISGISGMYSRYQ